MTCKLCAFESFHPLSLFFYYISILLVTMFSQNPVFLAFGFFFVSLTLITIIGIKRFFKTLPLYAVIFILISVTNPLFSQNGKTVLFTVFGLRYRLESLIYGAMTATMLLTVLFIFRTFSLTMKEDKIMYLFSKRLPRTALLLSITLRTISLLSEKWQEFCQTQKTLGYISTDKKPSSLKNLLTVFSGFVTYMLESAAETGTVLKARGYGADQRSCFNVFKFEKRDAALITASLSSAAFIIYGYAAKLLDFTFYPKILLERPDTLTALIYLSYAVLCAIPATINFIFERRR